MKTAKIIVLLVLLLGLNNLRADKKEFYEAYREGYDKVFAEYDRLALEGINKNHPKTPFEIPDCKYPTEEGRAILIQGGRTVLPLIAPDSGEVEAYLLIITASNDKIFDYRWGTIRVYAKEGDTFILKDHLENTPIYKAGAEWYIQDGPGPRSYLYGTILFKGRQDLADEPVKQESGTWTFSTLGEWFTGLGYYSFYSKIQWVWDGQKLRAKSARYKREFKYIPVGALRSGSGIWLFELFDMSAEKLTSAEIIIFNEWLNKIDLDWGRYREMSKEDIIKEVEAYDKKKDLGDQIYHLVKRGSYFRFNDRLIGVDDSSDRYKQIDLEWHGFDPDDAAEKEMNGTVKVGVTLHRGKWYISAVEGLPDWTQNKSINNHFEKKPEEEKGEPVPEAKPEQNPERESSRNAGQYIYTVRMGDTLSVISKKFYGTSAKWTKIQEANPNIDELELVVGMKLIIPDVEKPPLTPESSYMVPNEGRRKSRPFEKFPTVDNSEIMKDSTERAVEKE